jgi:sugar-specific transcriptional regulator TrmB
VEDILNITGLTKNQLEIYQGLLKHGPSSLSDITTFTGKYRSNTLDALSHLIDKGLVVTSYNSKRKVYHASNPSKITDICQENLEKAKAFTKQLEELNSNLEEPQIEVLSGKEGLRSILDDELKTGKTINVMQSSEDVENKAGSYLEISRNKRAEQGIEMRIIYNQTDKTWAQKTAKHNLTKVKVSRGKQFGATIDTYGDRVAIIFGTEPTIIKITDKKVAERFLQLFENSWKLSSPMK